MTDPIIEILRKGGIGVIPTDTIYGLVGPALLPETVERIYKVKGRKEDKPFIILISSYEDLKRFDINLSQGDELALSLFWPGKKSVIIPCLSENFKYLHRNRHSLAFRLPRNRYLIKLLQKTGPLVAPSANPEGATPAVNIEQAQAYFGSSIDFYQTGGKPKNSPSMIISLNNGQLSLIRGNKLLFSIYSLLFRFLQALN